MKKLDILMIKSFLGPFFLATSVADFILLIQYMLKYFDDFVGKNLGFTVFAELLFYFSLNMFQVALPLGVLIASLMTFGNLGENFELTAIKGSGISLIRTLRPLFLFIVVLSIGAFFFNNYTVPAANLKAYSLLFDIRQTKLALDIKEGTFYNGIPNYSIKAKKKLSDGRTLKDVIIYDHNTGPGNKTVILADSCLMYTIMDERYLKLELFNGNYYNEQPKRNSKVEQLFRSEFEKMELVFSLASFDLKRRQEELFQNNRQMKNIGELRQDIDSFKLLITKGNEEILKQLETSYRFHLEKTHLTPRDTAIAPTKRQDDHSPIRASFSPSFNQLPLKQKGSKKSKLPGLETLYPQPQGVDNNDLKHLLFTFQTDSIPKAVTPFIKKRTLTDLRYINLNMVSADSIDVAYLRKVIRELQSDKTTIHSATNKARAVKQRLASHNTRLYELIRHRNEYTIEKEKKYAQAMACILMFLIGAPLGAIIKKGGLGVPTIIAIFFFILYYVLNSIGAKSAKVGAMNPYLAVWMSDLALLPFGIFFLRQARIDARIFDYDAYLIFIDSIKNKFVKKKKEV